MYFLQVKGYWSPDQKETLSPDFLMEMMDLNEKLEDGVDEEAAKREVLLKIDEQNQGIEGVMAKDSGEIQESDIKIMIGYLNQKKYLKRILDRLLN
jgi:molecular chaperone HscB